MQHLSWLIVNLFSSYGGRKLITSVVELEDDRIIIYLT